jgi:hypothetical protein
MTHPFIHTVEKCAHCHLFVESNDAVSVEQGFAEYIHLSRGDEADEAIEGTHEAKPSGLIATLDTWKQFGPLEMRKRFTDYVPQPSIIMYWVGETLDDALADPVHDDAGLWHVVGEALAHLQRAELLPRVERGDQAGRLCLVGALDRLVGLVAARQVDVLGEALLDGHCVVGLDEQVAVCALLDGVNERVSHGDRYLSWAAIRDVRATSGTRQLLVWRVPDVARTSRIAAHER